MAEKLQIEVNNLDDHRIVTVVGEVDMNTSPALRDKLQSCLKGTPILKVDLKGVNYLDSSGIAVLIQGYKWAQKREIDYRLLDPSDQVKAVIELAMLQDFFSIESSGG